MLFRICRVTRDMRRSRRARTPCQKASGLDIGVGADGFPSRVPPQGGGRRAIARSRMTHRQLTPVSGWNVSLLQRKSPAFRPEKTSTR
jgi:hypothetical protein